MTKHVQLTRRDYELFESLYRDPKTAEQLFVESQAWSCPYQSMSRLQTRLRLLCDASGRPGGRGAGFLQRWRYHDNNDGLSPYYYKLSRRGFHGCFGDDAQLPSKRFLDALSLNREPHTRQLADCNVHTFVSARRAGVAVRNFYPENTNVANITPQEKEREKGSGAEMLLPDSCFDLVSPVGNVWKVMLELDRSTESQTAAVRRGKNWEETIRKYEALHYASDNPFRVFIFCTASRQRVDNLLELAGRVVKNPKRLLFHGIYLPDYLACPQPLQQPIFLDQNGRAACMIPSRDFVLPPGNIEEAAHQTELAGRERHPATSASMLSTCV